MVVLIDNLIFLTVFEDKSQVHELSVRLFDFVDILEVLFWKGSLSVLFFFSG